MATGSFSVQMRRFAEKAGKNMDLVVQHTTIKIANSVVERSPVGNPDIWLSLNPSINLKTRKTERKDAPAGYVGGRFRANWNFGEGVPDATVTDEVDPDGNKTKARLAAAIEKTGAGGVTYISNNLPYGPAIERGHSTQSPNGIVEITAIEFNDYVRQALMKLNK